MAQNVIEFPEPTERRLRMSYEEFLALPGENVHAEWVDGEVTIYPPEDERHQDLLVFLLVVVDSYVDLHRMGTILPLPFEVRLTRSAREPDLLFVAEAHRDRLASGRRLDGPPDLIVEVLSDLSATRDRGEKVEEYAQSGVPEYWMVDSRPDRNQTEFLQLGANGRYRSVPTEPDGRYHSRVLPGFRLRPEWLQQDPLPDPLTTMAAVGGDAFWASIDTLPRPPRGDA